MQCVPDDCLLTVFQCLCPIDVCRASQVCQQWYFVNLNEYLWRQQVLHKWNFASDIAADQSWRLYYAAKHVYHLKWTRGSPADFTMIPLRGHTNYIICSQLVDPLVFSGSADGSLKIWKRHGEADGTNTFTNTSTLVHSSPVNCLSSYCGAEVVSGDNAGLVRLWDIEQNTIVATQPPGAAQGVARAISNISVDEDCEIILTGMDNGVIKVWDSRLGIPQFTLDETNNEKLIHLGPCAWDKKQQIVSVTNSSVVVWDTRAANHALFHEHFDHSSLTCAHWHPSTDDLALGRVDGSVTMFNTKDGRPFATLHNNTEPVTCIHRTTDHVATGNTTGDVMLYNFQTENDAVNQRWKKLSGHKASVNDVKLDDSKVISAAADNCTMVHDVNNGKVLYALLGGSMQHRDNNPPHPQKPWCSAVHFDAHQVVVTQNSMLRVYNFS